MSWSRFCDNCDVWVEAVKCAANDSDFRVFVHEDDLPASKKWFAFDSQETQINCWSIDPADPRKCLPGDENVIAYSGDFPWSNCTECEATDEDDGEGNPGGPGGRPGAVPPLGDWPGGPGMPATPQGIKVTVCAGHEARATAMGWDNANLYLPAVEEGDEAYIANIAGVCVSVPTGPIVVDPDPAFWLWGGIVFETCDDCVQGVLQTKCAGNPADAPDVWIRKPDLADAPDAFEYGIWCYELATTPLATIPVGALILKPLGELPCDVCGQGVPYTLCAGQPGNAIDYWAHIRDVYDFLAEFPEAESVFVKIDGRCYELDLTATPSRMPEGAIKLAPACGYLSCEDCVCGQAIDSSCIASREGVPVRVCPGQGSGWRDTWLIAAAIPPGRRYFRYNGWCVYADPAEPVREIPADATVLTRITNVYASCVHCLWSGGPGGGGGFGGGDWPPDLPQPPQVPRPGQRWFQLRLCSDGTGTALWVLLPRFHRIRAGKVDGVCYQVIHPGRINLPVTGQQVFLADPREGFTGQGCQLFQPGECEELYHLQDCGWAGLPRTVFGDLAALVGRVVKIGATCWKVFAGDGGGPVNELNAWDDDFDACLDCEEAPDIVDVEHTYEFPTQTPVDAANVEHTFDLADLTVTDP